MTEDCFIFDKTCRQTLLLCYTRSPFNALFIAFFDVKTCSGDIIAATEMTPQMLFISMRVGS